MRPDTPILMITLQIPVLPDLSVDDVLEAIGQQVGEALTTIRNQNAEADAAADAEADAAEAAEADLKPAAKSDEVLESFTDETKEDLLVKLGYAPMG